MWNVYFRVNIEGWESINVGSSKDQLRNANAKLKYSILKYYILSKHLAIIRTCRKSNQINVNQMDKQAKSTDKQTNENISNEIKFKLAKNVAQGGGSDQ